VEWTALVASSYNRVPVSTRAKSPFWLGNNLSTYTCSTQNTL